MVNRLLIEGRGSLILNPDLNVEMGLYLTATYEDRLYNVRSIFTPIVEEKVPLAVMIFDRDDRRCMPEELNHIILATNLERSYEAIGLTAKPQFELSAPQWYDLGKHLEIILLQEAEDAILSFKDPDQMIGVSLPDYLNPEQFGFHIN